MVDHGFIGGVMVSLLPSSVVDHGFIGGVMVSLSETKDYRIGIVASPLLKYTALCSKRKNWFDWVQDNVSKVDRYVYLWTVASVIKHSKKKQLSLFV